MRYLIGVDLGTSATKTILVDENGTILASDSYAYSMKQIENGWAEQNPLDWKKAALTTIRNVVLKSGVEAANVKGIGISGQMHGLVMLDKYNQPLKDSIIWCDQRADIQVEKMLELLSIEEWLKITGNPPLAGWTAAKLLWVKENEPEIYQKCRHIMLPKDYVRFVLTGKYATDVSDASGMQILDVKNRTWSSKILSLLEIPEEWLGETFESQEIVGTLLPDVALECGLSPETIVVAGASDNASAALGTGIVKEGQAFTSIGTSAIVYSHLDSYRSIPDGALHLCCSAVPGCWHTMGGPQSAGLSMEWFREKFCENIEREAEKEQQSFYSAVNKLTEKIPIGSEHLIYLPFLMGERTPHMNPWYRGAFLGLNVIHSQAHMLRAIMEGVGYCLADCNDILKRIGVNVTSMRICGGGGRSPVWREIMASLYKCSVKTLKQEEGPAFGAAILAGVGTGIFSTIPDACDRFIQEDIVTKYDFQKGQIYQEYFQLYREFYSSLINGMHKLSKI